MSSRSFIRQSFDGEAFRRGLERLSIGISESRVLKPFRPLEFVASGGFVSVMHLHNRHTSQDLDYFLDAESLGDQYEGVRTELRHIVQRVARDLRYDNTVRDNLRSVHVL